MKKILYILAAAICMLTSCEKLKSVEEIDRSSAEEILGIGDIVDDFDE